jgi:hypothetical protein
MTAISRTLEFSGNFLAPRRRLRTTGEDVAMLTLGSIVASLRFPVEGKPLTYSRAAITE